MSEALIFALTNPQCNEILFIELQVQYVKILSSNLGRTCCVQNCFWHSEQFLYSTCSPYVLKKEELLTKIYLYKQKVFSKLKFWTVLKSALNSTTNTKTAPIVGMEFLERSNVSKAGSPKAETDTVWRPFPLKLRLLRLGRKLKNELRRVGHLFLKSCIYDPY